MTEPLPPALPPQPVEDELEELGDELRQKARPGERLIETYRRLAEEPRERLRRGYLLEKIVESLPVNVFAKDRAHRYVLANDNVSNLVGIHRSEVIGKTDFDILPEPSARRLRASDERVRKKGGLQIEELEVEQANGQKRYLLVGKTMVRFEESDEQVLVGFALDITERRRIEQDLRDKLALIERQQAVIKALSTPIIEVWEKVLTMPLLDVLDSARAGAVMEGLLAEVSRKGARFAIMDVTGVERMDTGTTAHLLKLIQAVRLLGAEGIITGIQPGVAQTMAALGLDLESITTLANLRDGLRHCIKQMRAGK